MNRIQTIVTPTGPLSVITPIAQQLLTAGVISGTLDGALHATDAATVKAAIMGHGVCDFCSAPGPTRIFDVPDFQMPDVPNTTSTGGWAACDACAALVDAGHRKALLARSIDNMAFPKFSQKAIAELHTRFWNGMEEMTAAKSLLKGVADFIEDRIDVTPMPGKPTDREGRISAIAKTLGLPASELTGLLSDSDADLASLITPTLAGRLLKWRKRYGDSIGPRELANLFTPPKQPFAEVIPHWQAAMNAQFEAATNLRMFFKATEAAHEYFPDAVDLHDKAAVKHLMKLAEARQSLKKMGFGTDLQVLPTATAYSFSHDIASGILEASQSIPHESPLSSVEPPNTGSGWFWFNDPLPFASASASSEHTHGLLWTWVNIPQKLAPGITVSGIDPHWGEQPALMFSAYVRDEKSTIGGKPGALLPSTRWFWPLTLPFSEMVKFNAFSWNETYGPGTPLEHDPVVMPLAETLAVIEGLSLFFLMSCSWFRQTVPGNPKKKANPILTTEPGHIERHARKRIMKDFGLDAPPTVRVVALRKSARVEPSGEPVDRVEGARTYHCRWIVKGHPRLQPCGPGRKDHKLIWIEAHPAGPDDKPFRTTKTVYAVIR